MTILPELIPDHKYPGWYFLKVDHDDGEHHYISVSPKLRLFEYPGGPTLGQISRKDFDFTKAITEFGNAISVDTENLITVREITLNVQRVINTL